MKILILYSTVDGHTLKICDRLQKNLESKSNEVRLLPIADNRQVDLTSFDLIVIGASIRYGKHNPQVFAFINDNLSLLNSRPNAFFTVNIVARKPEKNRPETNPYLQKFLRKTPWKPKKMGVFAGKLDYPKYGFVDRQMIRLIMWITKGPTDPTTVVEFTDWQRVDDFAQELSAMR